MYVILVYDIELKDARGQRVLRRVFKTCKQYLGHIQNSVFEGNLTKGQLMELKYELREIIRKDKDSVVIFSSRSEEWLNKDVLGVDKNDLSNLL